MAARDEDDTGGQPIFLMRPSDDVYSYFMFIGPTESKRHARAKPNWDIVMGYALIIMNFFMQGVLLYLIFDEVVVANVAWQSGILKLGGGGGGGHPVADLFHEKQPGCNTGGALCFHDPITGDYTCAPPSIQLAGRWDELDTNKDGIWTREEVMENRADLKCKYVVDPVEVFDVFVMLLDNRKDLIWLHPDVVSGTAIHLPYFSYAMADLVMCGYRSKEMCSNLIERGFFDAPLKHGTAPRVGTSIDSALRYCTKLLEPGGTCETWLPSTYAVWKVTSGIECGEQEFNSFTFTNPGNGVTKSLLSVGYSARSEYELAQDSWFMVFKGITVFIWLLVMVNQFSDIVKVVTFCARMPDAADFGEDAVLVEQDPSDPEDVRYRVMGITSSHRMSMLIISALRFCMTCVLTVVGVSYLIKTNGYADLIMNGVALGFIAEISNALYDRVLREEVKDQTGDIKPIKVRKYGWDWLNRRPALQDIVLTACIIGAVILIMQWQLNKIVMPIYDALDCTCLSQGKKCVEAQRYDYDFWYNYWQKTVPDIFTEVDKLKANVPTTGTGASYLAMSATAVTGDSSLEKRMDKLQHVHEELKKEVEELESQATVARPALVRPRRLPTATQPIAHHAAAAPAS